MCIRDRAYIGKGLDNGVRNQFIFAATQGQTAFTGADSGGKTLAISDLLYTDCYQNGVKLKPTTDYTVSLTTLTLVSAASLNDVVDIVAFDIFGVPDTVPASTGGTFGGGITATTGTFSGKITADAGIDIDNFNIDGNTIALSSGHINLDSAGQIFLDGADDGTVQLRDSGTNYGNLYSTSGDWYFKSVISDKDIKFQGVDGGAQITALTLDMSDGGTATFNHDVLLGDSSELKLGNDGDLKLFCDNNGNFIRSQTSDMDLSLVVNDGGNVITALVFDSSAAGAATFNSSVTENSDERLKSNITTIPDALSKVTEMRGCLLYTSDAADE